MNMPERHIFPKNEDSKVGAFKECSIILLLITSQPGGCEGTVINRGEFAINGLRNRDLQGLLYEKPATTPTEKRRRSAAVSRKLRMLRAHGVIHKLPHTHRYRVSEKGRLILNAVLSAQRMTLQQLTAAA